MTTTYNPRARLKNSSDGIYFIQIITKEGTKVLTQIAANHLQKPVNTD